MKSALYLIVGMLLMSFNLYSADAKKEAGSSSNDSLNVFTSPDLFSLSLKWADEYNRLNAGSKIRIIKSDDAKLAENLSGKGNIGIVSEGTLHGLKSESIWKAVVGRDVIVPIINSANPYLEEISRKGISPDMLAKAVSSGESLSWGTLLNNGQKSAAKFYCLKDEQGQKSLEGFLKTDLKKIAGENILGSEELISAVSKDPCAIGFCKLISVIDLKNQGTIENIKLLPIDRNGNGSIDYNEKIYDDMNAFTRGIWIGKYPKQLISDIYSVSSEQPVNENEIAFLKWVLADGQQYLLTSGYSELLVAERQSTTDKLNNAIVYPASSAGQNPLLKSVLFIVIVLLLAALIINLITRGRRFGREVVTAEGSVSHPLLSEESLVVPKGLYFDKTHTWAFMEQDGAVKVGIDDFLQHITGSITRIKMKSPGEKVKRGEQILSIIQNGKQLNLYSPVSGTIKEHNGILETNSSVINSSPYSEGWIYRIEPENWMRENQLLFMAEKQKQFIKNEFARLKDFLAAVLNTENNVYAQVILQDGGEVRDGVLSNLGPQEWEDFQTKFIDPSRQVWFYEIL